MYLAKREDTEKTGRISEVEEKPLSASSTSTTPSSDNQPLSLTPKLPNEIGPLLLGESGSTRDWSAFLGVPEQYRIAELQRNYILFPNEFFPYNTWVPSGCMNTDATVQTHEPPSGYGGYQ